MFSSQELFFFLTSLYEMFLRALFRMPAVEDQLLYLTALNGGIYPGKRWFSFRNDCETWVESDGKIVELDCQP